jgi:hypothetical protein
MINSLDEVIDRLQYKADNIKAKLEPSYFTECIDYLKTLPREENYTERLVNTVVKTLVDVFENLTIEDVNMYQIGYNKAIDEFAERLKKYKFHSTERYESCVPVCEIDWLAEQMKGE